MSTNGVTILAAALKEITQRLGSLEPGSVFRLPNVSFENAIGGDESGGCFYRSTSQKKDGLIKVAALDYKVERMLPEETDVIQHKAEIRIFPNRG